MSMDTNIIIVTHKDFVVPENNIYSPICVGTGIELFKKIYQTDNTGDNISNKNILYCELTALYWAWKNLDCETLGLVHYRRYFCLNKRENDIKNILNQEDIDKLLKRAECIVTPKRKYFQTVRNHYINCIKSRKEANTIQLDLLRETIKEVSPKYILAYDSVMDSHGAHMLNMFIMSKELSNLYCEWLFRILYELEKKIIEENVMFDRIMGAFGEFLLDTWLITNNIKCVEANIYETEKSLLKKIIWVMKRKLVE